MLGEREISFHRSMIYSWFIEHAPVLRKKLKKSQFTQLWVFRWLYTCRSKLNDSLISVFKIKNKIYVITTFMNIRKDGIKKLFSLIYALTHQYNPHITASFFFFFPNIAHGYRCLE